MTGIQQEFLDKQLSYAVLSGKYGTAQHLVAIGAKPDAATLAYAVKNCSAQKVKLLTDALQNSAPKQNPPPQNKL
jgi:hypothetical protein